MLHCHPYPPFLPDGVRRLIVGTLPPPRFSSGELRPEDVNFCYGSSDNLLWPVLGVIYGRQLLRDNSAEAVAQRKALLTEEGIGICDMVESCRRRKVDASDLGMEQIVLRDLHGLLLRHTSIRTMLFVGGGSKNGPEYLFRRQLRQHGLRLVEVEHAMPRRHRCEIGGRRIATVSLISPSPAANRAIGGNPLYKQRRAADPAYTTFQFRVEQYRQIFLEEKNGE